MAIPSLANDPHAHPPVSVREDHPPYVVKVYADYESRRGTSPTDHFYTIEGPDPFDPKQRHNEIYDSEAHGKRWKRQRTAERHGLQHARRLAGTN